MPTLSALAEFPQLGRLVQLRSAHWSFAPMRDHDGELIELRGVRLWPGGCADGLRLRYVTDAAAIRCDYDGHVHWQRTGSLADVADCLLALPAPDAVANDITVVCGECGGHGCKKCNYTGTVTIVE